MNFEQFKALKFRQLIMPIIIIIFIIMASYNHVIKDDTHEIDTLTNAFSKTYRYTATVYLDNYSCTYEFIDKDKNVDAGNKSYYTLNVNEDGQDIVIMLPVHYTIIKQYDDM